MNLHMLGSNFGAIGLCLEILRREPHHVHARVLMSLANSELSKQPEDLSRVFIMGDSHTETFAGPGQIFQVVHLGPRTMHGLGHWYLAEIDLANFGIRAGDCVTFVSGEIDVRVHIGRIRDTTGRTLDTIIDDLVSNYISAISAKAAQFPKVDFMVAAVMPPTGIEDRPDMGFHGDTLDRAAITLQLNYCLEQAALASGILYADIGSPFAADDGRLIPAFLDPWMHVSREFSSIVRDIVLQARAGASQPKTIGP
jgi:hypothetical protein